MAASAPQVHVAAEGQATATTRLWRFRGQLRVTVIVKATFALVHQGLMKLAPPDPLLTTDVHHGNSPVRSARLTPDLAPYLPATDVLLTGHAYAPAGERAAWVTAGIGILDGYEPILEKYLDVRGDMGPDGIQPFQKIPLVYERAFGGPGWEDNPFGVGAGGAKGEPNVFYIGDRRRSAGFGPYSAHWPARKKLVSPAVRRALSEPIAEIPEGFDWTYFHAAPRDQRCPFLTGSEWLVLQGLRPDERRVRTRLPAAKGRALVFWAGEAPEGEPLELLCDTLRIEPDRGVCSVTWRKSFAVAEESDLSDLRVLAGVEVSGQPIAWSVPEAATAPISGAVPAGRPEHGPSSAGAQGRAPGAEHGMAGAGTQGRAPGAEHGMAGAGAQGRAPGAEHGPAAPPGSGRRARVPTVTLSDADLEVLSDADIEASAVVPGDHGPGAGRPESWAERGPDPSGLLVSPEGRAAVRALAGTVDLRDRDTAPDVEPPLHLAPAPTAAVSGPASPHATAAPASPHATAAPASPHATAAPAAQTPGVPRPRAQTPAVRIHEAQTPAAQTPAVQTPAVQTPAVQTPAAQTPAIRTPAVQTPAAQKPAQRPLGMGPLGLRPPEERDPGAAAAGAQRPLGMGPLGLRPPEERDPGAAAAGAQRPLGMGPLGLRPPEERDPGAAAAGAQRPMILGSFRLAVFSPDYEEAPDDPLLSTLVIRNKPSPSAEPLRTTVRMEETLPPDSEEDMLQRTLVMKNRRPATRPDLPAAVIQNKVDPLDIDDPSATTLVLRNKTSPGGADSPAHGRPLGDLSGPPESTTGVLPARPMQPVPRAGPAGTIVIDDEDTEDTGPVPPELDPLNPRPL